MLHRVLVVGALAAVAVVSAAACGDDKSAPQQAALWIGLGPNPGGGSCSSANVYQYPDGARATVSTSGTCAAANPSDCRVKDGGDNLVDCDVRLAKGSTTNYNVSLQFQGGDIANFIVSGVLTDDGSGATPNTVNVDFITGQFNLSQKSPAKQCSATVKKLLPGAVWISALNCDDLSDPSSPSIACNGQGGLIFENCAH